MDFRIFDTLYQYRQLWSQIILYVKLNKSLKYQKKLNTVTCFISEIPICPKSINLAIFGELDYILCDHSKTNLTDINWYYQNSFSRESQKHMRVKVEKKILVTWFGPIIDFLKNSRNSPSRDLLNLGIKFQKVEPRVNPVNTDFQ